MSLEITAMERDSSGMLADHAFVAITNFSAVTIPFAVRIRTGDPLVNVLTGVPSKM